MALIFAGGVLIGGLIGWLGTEFLAASRTVWVLSRDDYDEARTPATSVMG